MMPLIVDAHEDLAWNMQVYHRDLTRSVNQTRALEKDTLNPVHNNGEAMLGWPEYQRGRVALIFATLFATPARLKPQEWESAVYQDFEQAHQVYRRQLEMYFRLTDRSPDQFHLIKSRLDLDNVIQAWNQPLPVRDDPEDHRPLGHPVGLVISIEGAEGIRSPDELEEWWELGVRLIGPAWAGNRFCGGTDEPGPLTRAGIALLEGMADLGFTLDISHMDEKSALQALEIYPGSIIASHSNLASLLKGYDGNRHLTERSLRSLLERNGRVGVIPFNRFLVNGWHHSDRKEDVTIKEVINQIDAICQLAGSAQHVGIGSDFDGGFGAHAAPAEMDTVADLQKIGPALAEKGYSAADIASILGKNWLTLLEETLPPK